MARDPLAVLSRLRDVALDMARRDLADRVREQAEAKARCAAVAAELARENAAQHGQPETLARPDDYVAWLRQVLAARRVAATAEHTAAAATDGARQSVHDARAAARTVAAALAHAKELRDSQAGRQEQAAVDEAAAQCGVRRRRGGLDQPASVERVTGIEPA